MKKRIQFNLDLEAYKELQKIAIDKEVSASSIVDDLIKEYVEKNKK